MKFTQVVIFFLLSTMVWAQPGSKSQQPRSLTGLPTISYNNSLGLQLGVMAMYMFDVSKQDTISPPSMLMTKGFYSSNDSWMIVLAQRLFLQDDNWRVIWALGKTDIKFQTYTEKLPGGEYVDYASTQTFGIIQASRRIYKRFYGGLGYAYRELNTEFYLEDWIGSNPDSLKILAGLSIPFAWDTRNNIYNASKGNSVNLKFKINDKKLASDLDFNTLDFDFNYYTPYLERGVIAARGTFYSGLGEVPFEGLKPIGRSDIRGYTKGTYRGDRVGTAQAEYRHTFPNKLGYVFFAGIAGAYNTLASEGSQWSGLLPGIGIGVRYMAIPERRMNLGVDIAKGIGDWGLYFRIGEAF
jgi:outer membrane protein assembly factor BamA